MSFCNWLLNLCKIFPCFEYGESVAKSIEEHHVCYGRRLCGQNRSPLGFEVYVGSRSHGKSQKIMVSELLSYEKRYVENFVCSKVV
jgi:hypothetical protein